MMPRFQLFLFFALAGLPFGIGLFIPEIMQYGIILTLLICLLAIFDVLLTPSLSKIQVGREVGNVLSVGAKNPVKIWMKSRNRLRIKIKHSR